MTENRGQRTEGRWRWVTFCLLFSVLCFLTAGCGHHVKLIRKKKNVTPPSPIMVLQSETQATHPPEIRYQEHFAYWKSWHSDLLDSWGQVRKRDLKYLEGTIGELRSMSELLSGPAAEQLKGILVELNHLEETWGAGPESWHPCTTARSRLEQLKREIDRDLHYSRVKEWIVPGNRSSNRS